MPTPDPTCGFLGRLKTTNPMTQQRQLRFMHSTAFLKADIHYFCFPLNLTTIQ